MQALYGYDVAADLQPRVPVRPGRRRTRRRRGTGDPSQIEIAPALRRAFDSAVPYMVNIATDRAGRLPAVDHRRLIGADFCPALLMNRSASTSTRCTVPAPITASSPTPGSVGDEHEEQLAIVNVGQLGLRPPPGCRSGSAACARARRRRPPSSARSARCGTTAATQAASASASSLGVPSTGRSPLPSAGRCVSLADLRGDARAQPDRKSAHSMTAIRSPSWMTSPSATASLVSLPATLGQHRDLHLHRLEYHQRVAIGDVVALGGDDLPHIGDHFRADLGHAHLPLEPSRPAGLSSSPLRPLRAKRLTTDVS